MKTLPNLLLALPIAACLCPDLAAQRRGFSGGQRSAPSHSAPRFSAPRSAPRTSAPRTSAPRFSAPRVSTPRVVSPSPVRTDTRSRTYNPGLARRPATTVTPRTYNPGRRPTTTVTPRTYTPTRTNYQPRFQRNTPSGQQRIVGGRPTTVDRGGNHNRYVVPSPSVRTSPTRISPNGTARRTERRTSPSAYRGTTPRYTVRPISTPSRTAGRSSRPSRGTTRSSLGSDPRYGSARRAGGSSAGWRTGNSSRRGDSRFYAGGTGFRGRRYVSQHYGYRYSPRWSYLFGLGFCNHLGWRSRYFYTYDPFYCSYSLGWGWNHYWRGYSYLCPLNYDYWWYPSWYSYQPVSYVYVNSAGDYSPYPSTTIVDATPGEKPASDAPPAASTEESAATRHVTLGDYYFKEGRYEDAVESYLRALAHAPEDASVHFVLADALFAVGNYHYADHIIRKAVRLDSAIAYAEADKRTFYKDPKAFEGHLAKLREYLVKKPYDVAAQMVLAYNLKFSGDRDGAIRAFERVLELSPANPVAERFLEALRAPKAPVKKTIVEADAAGSERLVAAKD